MFYIQADYDGSNEWVDISVHDTEPDARESFGRLDPDERPPGWCVGGYRIIELRVVVQVIPED